MMAFSAETKPVPEPQGDYQLVQVDKVFTDVGNFFDRNLSRFIIPDHGEYLFSVVAMSEGAGSVPIVLLLNGQKVMSTGRSESSIGVYPLGANRIVLSLSRGDYVDVRVMSRDGVLPARIANIFYSATYVTFLAYRIM